MSDYDALRRELYAISERLRHLGSVIPQMVQRLYRLEQRGGVTAPTPRVETAAPRPPQPEPASARSEEPTTWDHLWRQTETHTPPPAPIPAKVTADLEVQISGTWLTRIGVVAIIVGAILSLAYAFQSGWITPPM